MLGKGGEPGTGTILIKALPFWVRSVGRKVKNWLNLPYKGIYNTIYGNCVAAQISQIFKFVTRPKLDQLKIRFVESFLLILEVFLQKE